MKLIAIWSFDEYISANIIFSRLQNEGVNCFLQNENATTTMPFLSNITGGIKLMVPESELPKALELLKSFDRNDG